MVPRPIVSVLAPPEQTELPEVRAVASAKLPTRFGTFRVVGFEIDGAQADHVAVVRGAIDGASEVLVRLHSECLTGDALGSLRCDCRDQLEASLARIGGEASGAVIYLRQEGRGIGLFNKIRAYALQDEGLDTIDANRALGLPDDARDYAVAARMLRELGVQSVRLMTNNPDKVAQLERHGLRVSERVPHVMATQHHNRHYLETKALRSGHHLPVETAAK